MPNLLEDIVDIHRESNDENIDNTNGDRSNKEHISIDNQIQVERIWAQRIYEVEIKTDEEVNFVRIQFKQFRGFGSLPILSGKTVLLLKYLLTRIVTNFESTPQNPTVHILRKCQ